MTLIVSAILQLISLMLGSDEGSKDVNPIKQDKPSSFYHS